MAAAAALGFGWRANALPQGASPRVPDEFGDRASEGVYRLSRTSAPRRKNFQVAVVAEIARGFHMNSHQPSDEYLIPTTLTPQLPGGFQLTDTSYPAGRLQKFSFSPDKPLGCL